MPDVLAKDLLWPSLSIYFDIFLFLTFVYGRKLSCHVFTRMTTMASITFSTFIFSSQLGIQDWKKYEISFKLKKQGAMKHMSGEVCRPFLFPTTSVLYGDPPVSLRCWSCSEASGASFPLARTTDSAHECDRDVSEMTICRRFRGSIWYCKRLLFTDSQLYCMI